MKNNISKVLYSMIFIIFMVIIGISYAFFTPNINSNGSSNIGIKANNFNVNIIESNRNTGLLIPIADTDYITKASDIYYTITTTSQTGIIYNLKYRLIFSQAPSMNVNLKWTLTDSEGTVLDSGSPELISCVDNTDCLFMVKSGLVQTDASKNYHLYLWLSDDGSNQNSLIGLSATGSVVIEATNNY